MLRLCRQNLHGSDVVNAHIRLLDVLVALVKVSCMNEQGSEPLSSAEIERRKGVAADILNALSEVYDPEIGMNVVDLELIREVRFESGGAITVAMVLTTPFCPYAGELISQITTTASDAAGEPVGVQMLADRWVPPVGLF